MLLHPIFPPPSWPSFQRWLSVSLGLVRVYANMIYVRDELIPGDTNHAAHIYSTIIHDWVLNRFQVSNYRLYTFWENSTYYYVHTICVCPVRYPLSDLLRIVMTFWNCIRAVCWELHMRIDKPLKILLVAWHHCRKTSLNRDWISESYASTSIFHAPPLNI